MHFARMTTTNNPPHPGEFEGRSYVNAQKIGWGEVLFLRGQSPGHGHCTDYLVVPYISG